MAQPERSLSFPVVLMMTVTASIGMNIFILAQLGATFSGGWGGIMALGFLILLAIPFSLIFAELVGMFPSSSGGVYEYTKQAFSPFISFLLGWVTLLNLNLTIAVVIIDSIIYLNPQLDSLPLLVLSIGFVFLLNYLAYRGLKVTSRAIAFIGCVALAMVVIFLVAGLPTFSTENLATPPSDPVSGPFFIAIIISMFYLSELFFGWESATFLAGDAKDPQKNMPRAMWISTVIIAVILLAFTVVAIGNVGAQAFGASYTPFVLLAESIFGSAFAQPVAILVYLCGMGAVAVWIVTAPLLLMNMAQDKLFIAQLADLHPRHKTPYKAIIFQTVITSLLIIIAEGNGDLLFDFILPLDIVMYLILLMSFIILRRRKPDHPRPFKVAFGVPIAMAIFAVLAAMLVIWAVALPHALYSLLFDARLILLGIPVFLMLAFYYNPDAIIRMTGWFAYFSLWLENLLLPKRVRKEILATFKHLEEKHVLDYGAGVGTLTLQLAESVGPRGKVTATDLSEKNIAILKARLKKRGITHVVVLHDPHQVNRIHPDVTEVDVVFSVGMLTYIQDVKKVLKDIRRILPENGKICFVDYVDYFRILPNPEWIDDDERLKKLFWDAGFRVHTMKVRGLLWSYLFIVGEKHATVHKDVPYI
jgi:basic amino acid/polyamine antiporter, APA family